MVAVPITAEEPQVVVGSPALLARYGRPATPEDIRDIPCVTFRQAGIVLDDWSFNVDGEIHGIPVRGPLILDDAAACVHAAEQGVGLFRLPRSIVARNIHAGTLEVILSRFAMMFPGLALYYPSRSTVLPKLRAFVDYVLAHRV